MEEHPVNLRFQTLLLLGLTLLAFTLRVYRLDYQSLWYDEGFSVNLAGQGLAAITAGELNPPLYHYLLHFWLLPAGPSEFAVRFPSAVFGTLLVPLVARLGRLLFDPLTGLLGAVLATAEPFHIYYSQEARMYAMITFLAALSSYLLLRALDEPGDRRLWFGYWLASLVAIYTHYYAFLVLAAQGLYVILLSLPLKAREGRTAYPVPRTVNRGRRSTHYVLRFTFCSFLLALAYLPWLPFLADHFRQQTASYWPGIISLPFLAQRTLEAFTGGEYLQGPAAGYVVGGYGLLLALGLVAGLGEALRPRQAERALANSRFRTIYAVLYWVVPFVLTYALVHNRPKFSPRYLLVIWPAFALLVARGLRALVRSDHLGCPIARCEGVERLKRLPRTAFALCNLPAALALLCVLATRAYAAHRLYFDPALAREDFRGVATYLAQHAAPDEVILLESGHFYPVFTYYYPRDNWYPVPSRTAPSPSVDDIVTYDVARQLNPILAGRRGVWVVLWQNEVVDPNDVLLTLLDWTCEPVPVERAFHGVEVRHYRVPPGARLPEAITFTRVVESQIGDDLVLRGYATPSPTVPSGGTLEVLLGWKALRSMETLYKLSLRLHDHQGIQWAQYDARLAGFWYPTYRWKPGEEVYGQHRLPIPPGTPPGRYRLDMIVYRHPDGAHVKTLSLGEVTVAEPERFPAADELTPPHLLRATWEALQLLGYDLGPQTVAPGGSVTLTLFWEAQARPVRDYRLRIELGEAGTYPLAEDYPTFRWPAGAALMTRHRLVVPPDTPPGELELRVALADPAGRGPVGPVVTLATVQVTAQERLFTVPDTIQYLRRVDFGLAGDSGSVARLLGYDLAFDEGERKLVLTLYWQGLAEMRTGYTVFTHLLDAENRIWAQHDGPPAGGTRPTTSWLPGEVIVDRHELTVKPGAPSGTYVLEIGLYDALTGERLPAIEPDGHRLPGDRVILETLTLRERP